MELSEVKKAMAQKTTVLHDGMRFYIEKCCMGIRDHRWYYQLELHDLKTNSVCIADMEKVKTEEECNEKPK